MGTYVHRETRQHNNERPAGKRVRIVTILAVTFTMLVRDEAKAVAEPGLSALFMHVDRGMCVFGLGIGE